MAPGSQSPSGLMAGQGALQTAEKPLVSTPVCAPHLHDVPTWQGPAISVTAARTSFSQISWARAGSPHVRKSCWATLGRDSTVRTGAGGSAAAPSYDFAMRRPDPVTMDATALWGVY